MSGYLKVLIPVAVLGLVAFKFPSIRLRVLADPPPPPPKVSAVTERVDAAVEMVRAGCLPGFDKPTVGKAFEGRFQDARWSSFQTPNGVTIVNFHGTIGAQALTVAGLNASSANPIVVRSNCIGSLGLGAKMAEEAKSAQASEEHYRSAVADMEQRTVNVAGSPQSRKEQASAVTGRKQQEKAERELAAGDEAKIESCIAGRRIPVNFHFALSADQKKFQLGYIDKEPFGEAAPEAVLAFVYR